MTGKRQRATTTARANKPMKHETVSVQATCASSPVAAATRVGALLLTALVVAACGPEPDGYAVQRQQRTQAQPIPVPSAASVFQPNAPPPATYGPRITIERIAVMRDDIAYNNVRGLYIIRDTQTGAEYIGVSGIGISETGSHSAGKTRTRDER